MRRRWRVTTGRLCLLLLCGFIPLLALSALLRLPVNAAPASVTVETHPKWDDALHDAVADAPTARQRVVVYLNDQPTLQNLEPAATRYARAAQIRAERMALANETQADLLATLAQPNAPAQLRTSLWIINAVVVEGEPAGLHALASRTDVAAVRLDAARELPKVELSGSAAASALAPTATTWAVDQVRAPHVWHGLDIRGAGVTIALMDSGVSWQHPDLYTNYRGNDNGTITHPGNWYDVVVPTNTVPYDMIGHGTHVAGIAIGRGGTGVAPDADWIAVKMDDEQGFLFDSNIHLAYQWLLAPDGDPSLAPDVVNGSWGNPFGTNTVFAPDVATLRAAGIVQVYAAGNGGPFVGSIMAPASYTDTIAIGATDYASEIAWFSSRGPSPLVGDVKPLVVAPGAAVQSTWLFNDYILQSGTSMAAPHVSGAMALLLAADPALDEAGLTALLQQTARPIGTAPNIDAGWGLLDSYAATAAARSFGQIDLRITDGTDPVTEYLTISVTLESGVTLQFDTVDVTGNVAIPLASGAVTVSVAAFGYVTSAPQAVTVGTAMVPVTVSLVAEPAGSLVGTVQSNVFNQPLADVTVDILGTPLQRSSDSNGQFQASLPAGDYTIRAMRAGYTVAVETITITPGQLTPATLTLARAQSVLLVDGGRFLFGETGRYFTDALYDAGIGFDLWEIGDPFQDNPPSSTLAAYDAVIWSAPEFSPDIVDETYANVLYNYLLDGGNLLLTGQDLGSRADPAFPPVGWWEELLGADFVRTAQAPFDVTGVADTPFADLVLKLNGGDSANNQLGPDEVTTQVGSLTDAILRYPSGNAAALSSGLCQPFELVYFGFGLEGVAAADDRAALLSHSLNQFTAPPADAGVRIASLPIDDFILPGEFVTVTLPVFNLDETITKTFSVELDTSSWGATVSTPTLEIGPCGVAATTLSLLAPPTLTVGDALTINVTVREQQDGSNVDSLPLTYRMPSGEVLLIDDDRFYNVETAFTTALDAYALNYDVWEIGWDNNVRGSPSASFLAYYDAVIWFTGYDFFQPLSPAERETATNYVAGGGKLFLTSQDFLFYHRNSTLARDYVGVMRYAESISPTAVWAGSSDRLQPLTFGSYQNNGDGIYPRDPALVSLCQMRAYRPVSPHPSVTVAPSFGRFRGKR